MMKIEKVSLLIKNKSGQGLTEYLILLILVSIVSIAAATSLGSTIKAKLQEARNHVNKVSPYGATTSSPSFE